jgi:hypothetical protein
MDPNIPSFPPRAPGLSMPQAATIPILFYTQAWNI